MDEWNDWTVDRDPAEMIQQMRAVLADHRRSREDKLEALTLLTNIADEASVGVLRWYYEHVDAGLELDALLALMEATRLNRPSAFAPWQDVLVERIHEVGEMLTKQFGAAPDHPRFRATLVPALREDGHHVEEGGRALLKYEGQLIDITPLDLVLDNQVLVGFWDKQDEEAAMREWTKTFEDDMLDPLDRFYAALRASNLPWGILIDTSGETVHTDLVENMEVDRGRPRVEYILHMA